MTHQEKEKCCILWEGDSTSIVTPKDYDEYESYHQKDQVLIVPFLLKNHKFVIRKELIPSYSIKDFNNRNIWYSIISESVEEGETDFDALLRGLNDKGGIVIDPNEDILFLIQEGPIPFVKGLTSKVTIYLVVIGDFYQTVTKKNDSYVESKSETLQYSIDEINDILMGENFDFLFLAGMNMIIKTIDVMVSSYDKEKGLKENE